MTASPVTAVIVGFGNAGRDLHLPLLRAARIDIEAVVPTSPAARSRAHALGLATASTPDELDALRPDVVVVAVPDEAHETQFHRALRLSPRAVVVDKPVATSAAAAARMAESATAARCVLVPFQNRRWDGDYLTLKSLVSTGGLGELVRVTSRIARWAPVAGTTWREQRRAGLDGRLADLGSHLVDQLVDLLGPVESVYAEVRSVRDERGPNDDCFLALRHTSGAVGHVHMSAVDAALAPRFVAQGTLGAYQIDGMDPQQDQLRAGVVPGTPSWGENPSRPAATLTAETTRRVPTEAGDWTLFYVGLHQHLRGDAPPPVRAEEAVHVLQVLEAARVSATTRAVVDLG